MPNIIRRTFLLLSAVLLPLVAQACEYRMRCFFSHQQCAALIAEIVSERFTTRYPADKWQIVVIAEVHRFSNGGGTAFSIAGVAPRLPSEPGVGAAPAAVPKQRFSSVMNIAGPRHLAGKEEIEELENVIRRSVENLMTECERTPNCNVH